MKVVVFTVYTRWHFHYETDLEIMQQHLDAGDEVLHLHCNSELPVCEANTGHSISQCSECIAIRRSGVQLLSPRVKSVSFLRLTSADRQEIATLQTQFDSTDELRAYHVDNFDIGLAVLSSLISMTRDPRPDLKVNRYLVSGFMLAAASIYRSVQNQIRELRPDRVYVFNGRFATSRSVLRACQSMNVPCFTHDRGQDLRHFALWENSMPNDLAKTECDMVKKWSDNAAGPRRHELAEKFYIDRSHGIIPSWYSFVDAQETGRLPADWDSKKRNIAIFNSSEDEFEALGSEWNNPLYPSQQEGLERILRSLSRSKQDVHLYLRIHPNLKGIDNTQTQQLATLKADCLTVLQPEDPVCTYTLMRNADKTLTFGSTIGIEAVFWGIPSILAGRAFYENLGGTYNPKSHEELVSLLLADLEPKDKTAALMYGYYWNTYGIPFKYYEPLGMTDGKFKGQKLVLKPNPLWVIARSLERVSGLWYFARMAFVLNTRRRITGAFRMKLGDALPLTPWRFLKRLLLGKNGARAR
jgi:hypothetical protein